MWHQFAILVALGAGSSSALRSSKRQSDSAFDWSSIEPTHHLDYHPCYDGLKCARLKLPLDWTKSNCSSKSKEWVAIGITTLPATVPATDSSFGGTVLINPGGPGGAGTEMVLEYGTYLQAILEGERHYEILGFDPRGVGVSTPHADCYGDELNRVADRLQRAALPPVGSGIQALTHHHQVSQALSELCAQAGPGSIFNHMSTASVARDMVEIIERVDDLRYNTTVSTRHRREKARLQYIGVSYGTILGNTFASMFPERIGRMVLDGVADADDYMRGTWAKNQNDTEVVVDHFYETCFEAGDACALRKQSDSSASDIRGRIDGLIKQLIKSPEPYVFQGRARLVTSLLVRDAIRQSLYSPIQLYEPLSVVLAEALVGNYTLLLQTTPAAEGIEREDVCSKPSDSSPQPDYLWFDEAGMGVLCGDSAALAGERDISWAEGIVDTLEKQSFTAGEPWSRIALSCSGWEFRPKYAFTGPFGSNSSSGSDADRRVSAPLLVLSNRHDHATPLANAEVLSERHAGSALLVQEAFGHCALLTSKSACTAEHVRRYFDSGVLPKKGETCKADCQAEIPFKACPGFAE